MFCISNHSLILCTEGRRSIKLDLSSTGKIQTRLGNNCPLQVKFWILLSNRRDFTTGLYCAMFYIIKKLKCTLLQALGLCTGRTAHGGSRGIALPFHDHGTRRGWRVSFTPRTLFTPGKDPVPTVQEVRWAPGPVWTGAENLAPIGIRSPDRQARSQSLYRLRYPAHTVLYAHLIIKLEFLTKLATEMLQQSLLTNLWTSSSCRTHFTAVSSSTLLYSLLYWWQFWTLLQILLR
jgi:hypothetical protein